MLITFLAALLSLLSVRCRSSNDMSRLPVITTDLKLLDRASAMHK